MLFISLVATCLWSAAQQRQFSREKKIDDYIAAEMRKTATPGMAVA